MLFEAHICDNKFTKTTNRGQCPDSQCHAFCSHGAPVSHKGESVSCPVALEKFESSKNKYEAYWSWVLVSFAICDQKKSSLSVEAGVWLVAFDISSRTSVHCSPLSACNAWAL